MAKVHLYFAFFFFFGFCFTLLSSAFIFLVAFFLRCAKKKLLGFCAKRTSSRLYFRRARLYPIRGY